MSGWVVLQAGLHAWASKCWASCLAVGLPLWFPLQAHDCSEWRSLFFFGSLLACTAAFCSMVTAVGSSGAGLMSGWFVLQAGLHAWACKCWASCLAVDLPLWLPLQARGCSGWHPLWLHCCFLQHGDCSGILRCWGSSLPGVLFMLGFMSGWVFFVWSE